MTTYIDNGTEKTDDKYNGWANYETWNVALYIQNEESLYLAAREFMAHDRQPKASYAAFVAFEGLNRKKTADGVAWISSKLDYAELDSMMAELIS